MRPGDAAIGGLVANLRRYASPRERVCSVPLLIALQPVKYRQILTDQLNLTADGSLRGASVTTMPFTEVASAHRAIGMQAPGRKLVLEMPSSVDH